MSALSGVRAVFTLLAISIAFLLPGTADAQRTRVGAALLSFEANVSWSAVSADWRGLRPRWTQEVSELTSAADLGVLLLELESNIQWSAVSPEWRGRRPSWVQEANATTSESEVAQLLLDLEGNTLWSAVDGRWRGIRPGWVAELQQIASGGSSAPPPVAAPATPPPPAPAWIADRRTGCRAWNTEPKPRQTAAWSGACSNQLAQGPGVLQLFVDNQPGDRIEGTFTDGKLNGRGLTIHGAGGRTEGEFKDSVLNGRGIITSADGTRVDGIFQNGERVR